jgi:hypothetical protein
MSVLESGESKTVGQGNYVVRQGDCMASIAFRFGFFWESLWNLPENAELKRTRKDPNVLLPGDRVTVPELRSKALDAATGVRHQFVKKGSPAKFVMYLYEDGEPRADEPYSLTIDGVLRTGKLDAHGRLEEPIFPGARSGELIVGDDDSIPIQFGSLDPVSAVSGAQGRLRNLGFNPGRVDGILGPNTKSALRAFQKARGVQITGELDAATRAELLQAHGS